MFDQVDINEKILAHLPDKRAQLQQIEETVAKQNKQISALRYQLQQLQLGCNMMDTYKNRERRFQEEGGYYVEPVLAECEHVS